MVDGREGEREREREREEVGEWVSARVGETVLTACRERERERERIHVEHTELC